MKILFNNKLGLIFILLFSLSAKAEFRLGVDYTMVSNPMPVKQDGVVEVMESFWYGCNACYSCLLYTSPSPRDRQKSRMPSSA